MKLLPAILLSLTAAPLLIARQDYIVNIAAVINTKSRTVEQRTTYYPYGMPHGDATGAGINRRKFSGKELVTFRGFDAMDYHARWRGLSLPLFDTPDPLQHDYTPLSPYMYCGGDPVNRTDPSGCKIIGVSKKDAAMAVEDFRAMFPGDEFADFRNLIVQSGKKQNGKSIAPIPEDALSAAFSGITLNEDQQALMEIAVNAINSKDKHYVEYRNADDVLSYEGQKAFLPGYMKGDAAKDISLIVENMGGLPVYLVTGLAGFGATKQTKDGSHTVIVVDGYHPNGRAVTTGHEVLGHGRSWCAGYREVYQHVEAIRTENLILRVMGIPFINNGKSHGPEIEVPQPSLLPIFR